MPIFIVYPRGDTVEGWGGWSGPQVLIVVYRGDTEIGRVYSPVADSQFHAWNIGTDIIPGDEVFVTEDGVMPPFSKDTIVLDIGADNVDADANTVSGRATPNGTVQVD